MMNIQTRQFQRCNQCNIKPATIRRWINDSQECTKLCYNCDLAFSDQNQDQRKEIIPYEEMIDQSVQINKYDNEKSQMQSKKVSVDQDHTMHSNYEYSSQINSPNRTPQKQVYRQNQIGSNIQSPTTREQQSQHIKQKYSRNILEYNQQQNLIITDYNSNELQKSEAKALDLKYRIKLQEQENTIQLLKSHLENIEQRHQENINRTKIEIQHTEEIAYKESERYNQEIIRIKMDYELKNQAHQVQIQQERNRNELMEQKLENLRKTHETKIIELQQQISKLRAEVERYKLEKEKILAECDHQITLQKQLAYNENETVLNEIKREFNNSINDYRDKLSKKMDEIMDGKNQIQQLLSTLKEIQESHQSKINQMERDQEELMNINQRQKEMIGKLEQDKKNIFQEYTIAQKELELFQVERQQQSEQIKQATEKHEKLEKFIYGSKKDKKKKSDKKEQKEQR